MKVPAEVIYSLSLRPRSKDHCRWITLLVYSTLKGSFGCGRRCWSSQWINWLVQALLADELP